MMNRTSTISGTVVASRPRKAAYSVAETAALCGISRARFYDHIASGAMPPPVYALRTRRPFYPADQAALCVRIRETSIGFDGHYVLFYDRKPQPIITVAPEPTLKPRKVSAPDPMTTEMVDTLKAMGVRANDEELLAAIGRQCPQGVTESTFEDDLRAVFDAVRRRESV